MDSSRAEPRTETSPADHLSVPLRGLIFDVKRFAVHDGPGIRTVVFFKGCPLRCVWCHNPESLSRRVEVMYHPQRCVKCLSCVEACPTGAQTVDADDRRGFNRAICDLSLNCVNVCFSGALEVVGRSMAVDEVMAEVREDVDFYRTSGGGVTLSGGEPLLQHDFAEALLRQCKVEGIHTALDTSGQVRWPVFERVLPFVDLVLYDVKHMSPDAHSKYTGASNRLILENLRRLNDRGVPTEIRMVIVPGLNDSQESIEMAGRLLGGLDNVQAVRLLPYHRLAGSKYVGIGKRNSMPEVETPSASLLNEVAGWLSAYGLAVVVPD